MKYIDIPFFWINKLSILSRKEVSHRFSKAGYKISPEEWALLLILWGHEPQTPSKLSDQTIKDRTTVTRLIDMMVGKGFVIRNENPGDRRKSDISLTPLGKELQSKLVPIAMGFVNEATANIPPEDIEITLRTLRAFAKNIDNPSKS